MGGSETIIASVVSGIFGTANTLMADDPSKAIKKEREAREKAQQKREADARRRERDKVLEARDMERRDKASKLGETTLTSGAGNDDAAAAPGTGLKQKLGE